MALPAPHSLRFSSRLSSSPSEGLVVKESGLSAQERREVSWRQKHPKGTVRCGLKERDGGRKVIVIGGGVGGLAVGGKLAKEGFAVQILEKNADAGGRVQSLRTELEGQGSFRFDTGPSLLLLPQKYRDAFTNMGTKFTRNLTILHMDS